MIAIKTTNNNGTPPKFKLPIKSTTLVAITLPILDHSSNPNIIDEKNNNTKIYPVFSNDLVSELVVSLLFLILPDILP